MSGKPLAHSSRPKRGIPPQLFWEHIERVRHAAGRNAGRAARYWKGDREFFEAGIGAAGGPAFDQRRDCEGRPEIGWPISEGRGGGTYGAASRGIHRGV